MARKLQDAFMTAVSAMLAGCATGAEVPPSPPPLPWHVNAYIGFERADDLDQPGTDRKWYLQNSLQIDGSKIRLHKQTVFCEDGRMWSSEGDGGAKFFGGEISGGLEGGVAILRYVKCDLCLSQPEAEKPVGLPLQLESPGVIQLGSVEYRRDTKPYPDLCPRDI